MKVFHSLFICLLLGLSVSAQEEKREFEMTEGEVTYTMKRYIFCLLKAGPNRNQHKEAVDSIQALHMDHLNKMAEEGSLKIAGPFGDDGEYRGILIFDLTTIDEARSLVEKDPAIKTGRLIADLHPWWTMKGVVLD